MSHHYYALIYCKDSGDPVALANQVGVSLVQPEGRSPVYFRAYGEMSELQKELLSPFFSITRLEVSDKQEDQAFYEEICKNTETDHLGGIPGFALKVTSLVSNPSCRRSEIAGVLSIFMPEHRNAIRRWMKIDS